MGKKTTSWKKVKLLLEKGINDRIFSAVTTGIFGPFPGSEKEFILQKGKTSCLENAQDVNSNAFYDLASLTKPLVTVLSLLVLCKQGRISIDSKVAEILVEQPCKNLEKLKVIHLLNHSSGLPAHREYYHDLIKLNGQIRKKWLVDTILKEPLITSPGENSVYSDLGFMLLGMIVEKISGKNLEDFWNKHICYPLSLKDDFMFPLKNDKSFLVVNNSYMKDQKEIVVNDENCRALSGVAGHAGLFGTCRGVLCLCQKILFHYHGKNTLPMIAKEDLVEFLTRKSDSGWCLGFDTVSKTNSSSGNLFSPGSVGHLGFTGVSFWIDLARKIVIVLLTNRVHASESNEGIKKFRPIFHDEVMRVLPENYVDIK